MVSPVGGLYFSRATLVGSLQPELSCELSCSHRAVLDHGFKQKSQSTNGTGVASKADSKRIRAHSLLGMLESRMSMPMLPSMPEAFLGPQKAPGSPECGKTVAWRRL